MRIAVLGDLHFIAPDDPFKKIHSRRKHFAQAWPSAQRIFAKIRDAAPDLVISLGDLVDYYSKENRDFALELLGEIQCPWFVTPGNHDFETYSAQLGSTPTKCMSASDCEETATAAWAERGIELQNRLIDAGDTGILLVNSACSTVSDGTREWLNDMLPQHPRNILFTHTPLDQPEIRSLILNQNPKRNLKKYVQSGAPWVYEDCIRGQVEQAFFGHLHFADALKLNGTHMYFRGLSIMAAGREYDRMGEAMILDIDNHSTPSILTC
jgi:3',5'-cyclic AMP phosphodiesterase CpdA